MADNYRYPGPRSFSYEQRSVYFGRDEDIANLRTSVIVNPTTVLFGKSGTGKSSIIQAGLLPKLLETKEKTDKPTSYLIINVMPKPFEKGKDLWQEIKNIIINKIDPENIFLKIAQIQGSDSLWYILKNLQYSHCIRKISQTVLLIFDQCEELFTYPDSQVDHFIQELYPVIGQFIPEQFQKTISEQKTNFSPEEIKVLYEPMVIKFLFSIRSDKLHLITRLKKASPYILQNSYELLPLTKCSTFEAINKPSRADGDFASNKFTVTDDAKEYIFQELSARQNEPEDYFEEARIDPFSLQIICSYIERNIVPNKTIIDKNSFGKPEEIIKGYYESSINQLNATDEEKTKVKNFIELKLLQNNRRIPIHEDLITGDEKFSVSKELLNELVDFRILKKDISISGGLMYEITHDCFIAPIAEAREERMGKTYENKSMETINDLLKQIQKKETLGTSSEAIDKPAAGLQDTSERKQAGIAGVALSTEDYNLSDLYKKLGDAYMVVQEYQKAIEAYTKAIETEISTTNSTTLIETYRARANAYYSMLDYERSNEDLEKILQLNPADYLAVFTIAQNKRDENKYPEAIQYFEKAVALNPANAGIYNDIGNIYFYTKEYEKAKNNYQKTVEINPDADYAWSNLGLIEETLGNSDEALKNYNVAVKLNPLANIYNTIGNIYFAKKDYTNAKINYLEALKNDPGYYYSFYNLGLVEENSSNPEGAIMNYNKSLELNPNYELANTALANLYFQKGDFESAKTIYNKIISINPTYDIYYSDLGIIEQKLGNWNAAIDNYKKALELNPSTGVTKINSDIGTCYFNLKEWQTAEEYFIKALNAEPNNYLHLNNLCAVNINKGDYKAAEDYIKKSIENNPSYSIAYFNYGNLFEKKNETDQAIEKYKKAIELDPGYADPYLGLAGIYFNKEQYHLAKEIYLRLISVYPNNEIYYKELGTVEHKAGNEPAAIDNLKKAIELNPNFESAYILLADSYIKLKDYKSAENYYKKLIAINPTQGDYYFDLAGLESDLNNGDEAIKNYEKAIEINPNDKEAYEELASIYFEQEDYEKSKNNYIKLISLDPRNKDYYYDLAIVDQRLNNWDEAIIHLKKVLVMSQEGSIDDANNDLGLCYFNLQDWKNAELYFMKALESQPNNYLYLSNACAVNISLGNFEIAEKYIKKSLDINPEYGAAYYNYGYLFEQNNKIEAAIKNYKKCLELDPGYELAKERLEKLKSQS